MSVFIDGKRGLNNITIPATGSYSTWQTVSLGKINIESGEHKLRVVFDAFGFNLNELIFSLTSD